jgi:hypothetical protein
MCVEVAAETIYIVLCKWGLSVRCMHMIPKVSHVEIHNIVVQIPVNENSVVTCTICDLPTYMPGWRRSKSDFVKVIAPRSFLGYWKRTA